MMMMMMIFCAEKKRDPFEVLVLRAYICIYKYIYYIYMVVMVLQSTLFEQISVPF